MAMVFMFVSRTRWHNDISPAKRRIYFGLSIVMLLFLVYLTAVTIMVRLGYK